jgi:hypothetical protein
MSHDQKQISTRRHFHKYPNKILVESGSYLGDGIQDALDCGFERVISFEVIKSLVQKCRERFKDNPKVQIVEDTSSNMLQYIGDIKEPITFWLDGHWTGESSPKDICCPVLKELDAIAKHPIKTHTILIDDVRLFSTSHFGNIPLSDVIGKIQAINSKYQLTFLDGHCKRDVLVASLS